MRYLTCDAWRRFPRNRLNHLVDMPDSTRLSIVSENSLRSGWHLMTWGTRITYSLDVVAATDRQKRDFLAAACRGNEKPLGTYNRQEVWRELLCLSESEIERLGPPRG